LNGGYATQERAAGLCDYCFMPQYFFRVENGEPIAGESEEFPDDGAARAAAEDIARELSKNRIDGKQWRIVVTNEAGEQIALVPTLWVQK
jgi:hypothetical protein